MSTLDIEALKTVVAEGRRTAGAIAASAEMLSWRNRFRKTEETDELVRVLYEDVPLVLRAQSRTERFLRQIDVSAGRGVDGEQLERQRRSSGRPPRWCASPWMTFSPICRSWKSWCADRRKTSGREVFSWALQRGFHPIEYRR